MSFADEEFAYLRSQPLARLATVGPADQPDVVPVALEFDGTFFWVGGDGRPELETRKFRNVNAGRQKVALVMDDMVSFDPFIARSIRIYGYAEAPFERVGMVGPGIYMRITPPFHAAGTWPAKPTARLGISRGARSIRRRPICRARWWWRSRTVVMAPEIGLRCRKLAIRPT